MELSSLEDLPKGACMAFYGGSFDPPHLAHFAAIESILKNLDISALAVMPAYQNPLKPKAKFQDTLRLSWMKRLCQDINIKTNAKLACSDYEIIHHISLTKDSIAYIKKILNPKKIFLVLGADNFCHLKEWEGYEYLEKNVEFVLIKREGVLYNSPYRVLELEGLSPEILRISSTFIRDGRDYESLRPFLVPSIADCVIQALVQINKENPCSRI